MGLDIIARVKCYCSENSINDSELARRLAMSQKTVNSYLNGSRKISFEFIMKLISTFGLSPDWLLLGEEPIMRKDVNSNPLFDHKIDLFPLIESQQKTIESLSKTIENLTKK